jgi:hypothetical protein
LTTREFKFGEALPPDDGLSTWACGLALAFNDLILAHRKMEETEGWEFFYWWRVAVGHYTEAMLHLERERNTAEVRAFTDALEGDARAYYEEALGGAGPSARRDDKAENRSALRLSAY